MRAPLPQRWNQVGRGDHCVNSPRVPREITQSMWPSRGGGRSGRLLVVCLHLEAKTRLGHATLLERFDKQLLAQPRVVIEDAYVDLLD
jgi:hypothetical protein